MPLGGLIKNPNKGNPLGQTSKAIDDYRVTYAEADARMVLPPAAEEAKPVIDTLMKGGTIRRGYLGIAMQDLTADIADSTILGRTMLRTTPVSAATSCSPSDFV